MQATTTVRRYYAPLDVSVCVECVTPDCPMMQTYDGASYVPDREASGSTGTKLKPVINATASDGTWNDGLSNINLANIVWYAFIDSKWQDVTSAWSGKVSVDTSATASKGTLTVNKNVPSNSNVQLRFEADLVDYRTNDNHHLVADPVTLVTADKGEDTWGISIDCADNIVYNPAMDALDLYEYKTTHGYASEDAATKEEAYDGNQYDFTIPVTAYKGTTAQTSGYTLKVYRMNSAVSLTELQTGSTELTALSLTSFTLDLRLIDKASYLIGIIVSGSIVAQKTISVTRKVNTYQIDMMNSADFSFTDVQRWNKAKVMVNNSVTEYPSRFLQMNWSTKSTKSGVTSTRSGHEGDYTEYKLSDLYFGTSESDTVTDVLEYEPKSAHQFLTDENNERLTDENGNYLIAN